MITKTLQAIGWAGILAFGIWLVRLDGRVEAGERERGQMSQAIGKMADTVHSLDKTLIRLSTILEERDFKDTTTTTLPSETVAEHPR